MLPEYDFSKQEGVRGKYYRAYREGYTVTIHHADGSTMTRDYQPDKDAIVLDPDVRAYFPDSRTVNNALRALIAQIPKKRKLKGVHQQNRSCVRYIYRHACHCQKIRDVQGQAESLKR